MGQNSNQSGDSSTVGRAFAGLPNRGVLPTVDLIAKGSAGDTSADALVYPVAQGENGLELAVTDSGILNSEQENQLWQTLITIGATAGCNEVTEIPGAIIADGDSAAFSSVIAVGLGDADKISDHVVREAAGTASRKLDGKSAVSLLGVLGAEASLVGHGLGAYRFSGFKAAKATKEDSGKREISVVAEEADAETLKKSQVTIESVGLARDLVNTPANYLYPETYADLVAEIADSVGLEVEVLDEKQLEEQGFGGIIGVGKGSEHAPRLVRLMHSPANAETAPSVALVGKGVTFDTGGISLKPGANMWDMISDMGGSAAVIASMIAVARLDVPVKVTATIPMAENSPSATATRPGDILRHYNGLTTEVLNTDAEGRLILGDAMARASEDKPDYLIETATLTGAQMVALGNRTPGVMGSMEFRDLVASISQSTGENAWAMPLPAELGEALKSDVADVRNISTTRWGGMLVAGHYLSNFVGEGIEWAHIDVAGPAYNTDGPYGYTPKRGTGVPVRTILATIDHIADNAK